jgi:hypothetical protein
MNKGMLRHPNLFICFADYYYMNEGAFMFDIKSLTGLYSFNYNPGSNAALPCLFIIIIKTKDCFRWTNAGDMLAFEAKGSNLYKYAAFGLMIIYACAYCIIPVCLKANQNSHFFGCLSLIRACLLRLCLTCLFYSAHIYPFI